MQVSTATRFIANPFITQSRVSAAMGDRQTVHAKDAEGNKRAVSDAKESEAVRHQLVRTVAVADNPASIALTK